MRKILMSKPGEFDYKESKDQSLSAAVKMLAKVMKNTEPQDSEEVTITESVDHNKEHKDSNENV